MRRLRTAVIALVLAGSLAACGDDGDAEPQDPVTASETASDEPMPSETTSAPPATESTEPTEPTEPSEPTQTATSVPATPSPAVDLSQPPTSYAEAKAHLDAAIEAGGAPQELRRFESAGGAYYCSLGDRYIPPSCELLDGIKDPEVCADSPSQKVGRIELTERGWQPFCNTDTIRMPGATVVPDGGVGTWSRLSVECVMESIGVTCLETGNQQGFFLGAGRYQVF